MPFQNTIKVASGFNMPVILNYYSASLEGKACIGVDEYGDKYLVKSEDAIRIKKIFKLGNEREYILLTLSSTIIVSDTIKKRHITNNVQMAAMAALPRPPARPE